MLDRQHVLDLAQDARSLAEVARRLGVDRRDLPGVLGRSGEGDLLAEVREVALAPSRRPLLTDEELVRSIRSWVCDACKREDHAGCVGPGCNCWHREERDD